MAVPVETAQRVIAFAMGQDQRLRPTTENDATAMVAAWSESLPDWLTFDLAREALVRRAQDPRSSLYPVTIQELVSYAATVRRRREQRARNERGVYSTLTSARCVEGDRPVPMPPGFKQGILKKINRKETETNG